MCLIEYRVLQFLVCYSLSPKCIQFIFHLKILQIIPPTPKKMKTKSLLFLQILDIIMISICIIICVCTSYIQYSRPLT